MLLEFHNVPSNTTTTTLKFRQDNLYFNLRNVSAWNKQLQLLRSKIEYNFDCQNRTIWMAYIERIFYPVHYIAVLRLHHSLLHNFSYVLFIAMLFTN